MNKVFLYGRVGQDPKIRTFDTGNKVANFSLATNEGYYDKSKNWIDKTEWHNIVAGGRLAERVESKVVKGAELLVEGKIATRSYDKDGQTIYITEIIALSIKIVGGSKQGSSQPSSPFGQDQVESNFPEDDGDLPF